MASVRKVAREAGVSIATVSRVLNGNGSVTDDLRERVLKAADQCDYRPTVGKRSADRIALIYLGPFCVASPYDSACLEAIVAAMRQTAYDLVVIDIFRDRKPGETFSQFFARKGVCGAIVRSTLEERAVVMAMADEGVPVVVLGDHFDHPNLPLCYAESREASREATEHLLSLGHKSIAYAGCDRDDGDHLDRLEAYREVLEAAGVYREEFVYRVPPLRMDGGPLLRRVISKKDRPTAIFIADPLVAVGALNEAHDLGVSVPGELSIVGVDDADMRNMVYPRMTSVCQDAGEIGLQAFKAVQRLVETPDEATASLTPQKAWFELQDTTAPPPASIERYLPGHRQRASY